VQSLPLLKKDNKMERNLKKIEKWISESHIILHKCPNKERQKQLNEFKKKYKTKMEKLSKKSSNVFKEGDYICVKPYLRANATAKERMKSCKKVQKAQNIKPAKGYENLSRNLQECVNGCFTD
jgi:hypothetical protein